VLKSIHNNLHLGWDATQVLTNWLIMGTGIKSTVHQVWWGCPLYSCNNHCPKSPQLFDPVLRRGSYLEDWQVDFTHMPFAKCASNCYFSYFCRIDRSLPPWDGKPLWWQRPFWKIPSFDLSWTLQSNMGQLCFTSQRGGAQALGIKYLLHST
jgi:hypothetical protein